MTNRAWRTIPLLAACGLGDGAPTPDGEVPEPVRSRTQYDLLADIRSAERTQSVGRVNEVRADWQGRTLRWDAYRVDALCPVGDRCHVVPFDHARVDDVVRQGWLPRLELDAADAARLVEVCAPHEACVITFEGRLEAFRFSLDHPTELGFVDVGILAGRSVRDGESWGRRHVPGRGHLDALRAKGKALRERGFTPTLRPSEG